MSAFSEELKRRRKKLGLNQTELAEKLGLTKPDTAGKNQVSRWETQEITPDIRTVRHLETVLGEGLVDLWIAHKTAS